MVIKKEGKISKFFIFTLIIIQFTCSCAPVLLVAAGTGVVIGARKDETLGNSIDNEILSSRVKAALISYCPAKWRFVFTNISVIAQGNKVYLNGTVEDGDQISKAIEIAWEEKGVNEVINELKIDENSRKIDIKQYTIDTAITTNIKTKMIFNKNVKSVNFTVLTINNVVHLFGLGRSAEEITIVHDIAASAAGVEEVVSHIKLIQQ